MLFTILEGERTQGGLESKHIFYLNRKLVIYLCCKKAAEVETWLLSLGLTPDMFQRLLLEEGGV